MRANRNKRNSYSHFHIITTRWMDNDVYGHVNNVIYYSWFDTAVNQFLIANAALDIESSQVIGLAIESQCNYFSPVTYPDQITIGLCVSKIGNSSVRYEVGVFRENEDEVSAQGHFVHVYVSRETRKSAPIPDKVRLLLNSILSVSNND